MMYIFAVLFKTASMKVFYRLIKKQLDALIYGLIGPFSVLYLFPQFCLSIENQLGIDIPIINGIKYVGIAIMNIGLLIALWSAYQMFLSKKQNPSPFSLPKKVVKNGLFAIVRHPMMWSLHFVLIGQILVYHSPLIMIWFLLWLRFSYVYIARYEEPYLISVLGKEYIDYCKTTPRWIPKVLSNSKRK